MARRGSPSVSTWSDIKCRRRGGHCGTSIIIMNIPCALCALFLQCGSLLCVLLYIRIFALSLRLFNFQSFVMFPPASQWRSFFQVAPGHDVSLITKTLYRHCSMHTLRKCPIPLCCPDVIYCGDREDPFHVPFPFFPSGHSTPTVIFQRIYSMGTSI